MVSLPHRTPLFAAGIAGILLLAAPAQAQESKADELAETLSDPMTQYAVAGMLSALSRAVLDMEVEPLATAMKDLPGAPSRDLPPVATVGDLAGTDARQVRDTLIERVPAMMGAMARMAGAVGAMTPEIEKMADRVRDTLPARD